jgi:shikimate kinase
MAVRAVFLVGYMACGKSSLGQQLARRLDWDFVDLDALIEGRERQTIADIFRERGENAFRAAETSALRELTESLNSETFLPNATSRDHALRDNALRDDSLRDNALTDSALRDSVLRGTVVALGGGTFAHPTNRDLLRPWPTVFLDAPLDELWQRSQEQAATRPLRKDRTEFDRLHQERLPLYRQATVTVVTSGKDPNSLCAEIERSLHSWRKTDEGKPDSGNSSSTSTDHFETGEIK